MKYPYTTIDITIDITIASQVSGQVLLLDVVLAVGRSFLLMISVRALSGKQPVDDLLRLARNVPTEIHFGYREIGVELLAQKSIEPLAGRSSFKSFSTTDLRDQF